jgi:hypothetical protein
MFEKHIEFTTGAAIDNRTADQKDKDWRPQEAFASADFIDWKEKTIEEVEKEIYATSISQGRTSRCVSEYAGIFFEMAEFLENKENKVFSRRDIYCRRYNRPEEGMAMFDLFKLMREGTCFEHQLPSTDNLESDINKEYTVTDAMLTVRKTYAADASFTWSTYTIDDFARIINQGIPVCLFWYFDNTNRREWWNGKPKVVEKKLGLYDKKTARHQAAGVVFLLVDGVKHIAVLDSAGQGTGLGKQKNIRLVSEDFIKERCFAAGFAIDKKNLDYEPTPYFRHTFTKNLRKGMTDPDVLALQKILILEGCLSLKTPTEFFGGMTEAALIKFQEKYAKKILAPLGLKRGTGLFLTSTRAFVNAKYGKENNG